MLFSANLNYNLIKHLNNENINVKDEFNTFYNNINKNVKSNVAISAAVTAYGRIERMKYKTLDGYTIYYSDTDSAFLNKPLPQHLVGNGIGLMKDELNGKIIKRALFLGNKKYIYQYYNDNNILQTVSVFSGVKRNTLTWDDFYKMSKGEVIIVKIPNTFIIKFKNLDLEIKDRFVNISKSKTKNLINNIYQPLHIIKKNHKFNPEEINHFKTIFKKLKKISKF